MFATKFSGSRSVLLVGGLIAATAAPVRAQQASDSPAMLEEIIVTAAKREQSLIEVPASITVLSGEQLDRRGIESFDAYARGIPGISFQTTGPGQTKLALRGIPNLGVGATVAMYVDETPLTSDDIRTSTSDPGVFDVERIEVLRGPQGTLYGASALAGAIRVITRKPDLREFSGRSNVVISQIESGGTNYGADGMINLPLADDIFALRLSGSYRRHGGFVDRIGVPAVADGLGLTGEQRREYLAGEKDADSGESYSMRAVGLLKIGDNFTLTPSVFATRHRYDSLSAVDSSYGGEPVSTVVMNQPTRDGDMQYGITAEYDLGFGSLTSATTYVDREYRSVTDFSRAVGMVQPFIGASDVEIFTQEVRLASAGKNRFDYIVGVFYWDFQERGAADLTSGSTILYRKSAGRDNSEKAVFGELTFNASEQWHITAGIRAYDGERELFDANQGLINGNRSTRDTAHAEYDGVNPKLTVSYELNDDLTLYGTAARGYRAGGANISVPSTCAADLAAIGLSESPKGFNPDKLWNYELGAKSVWQDGRLTANVAAYHIDWSGIQVRQPLACGFSFLTNGASATSDGFELEFVSRPLDGLTLELGVGYADTELDRTPNIAGSLHGSAIPGVPDWTGNAGLTYERQLPGAWRGTFSTTYQYGAAYRSDLLAPNVVNERSKVNNLNLRADFSPGHWRIGVFADNVLNKVFINGAAGSGVVEWLVSQPRTVGLRMSMDF
jgi:outer membrane receptor protein involved in Fe transport